MECALISPGNPHIIRPHLLCAAYELPLTPQDKGLFGPSFESHVKALEDGGLLRNTGATWHITPSMSYPAEAINIRSTFSHNYLVVEKGSGMILETVEEASVLYQLHPGAIYLHHGEPYLVKELDLDSRIATVEPNDGAFYTQTRDTTDISVLDVLQSKLAGTVMAYLGTVEVTNQVLGFNRRRPFTEQVIDEQRLDLPPRPFHTVALWFDVPEHMLDRAEEALPGHSAQGLAGGLHAAIGVLPLFALCDRNDIWGVSTTLHPDTGRSRPVKWCKSASSC